MTTILEGGPANITTTPTLEGGPENQVEGGPENITTTPTLEGGPENQVEGGPEKTHRSLMLVKDSVTLFPHQHTGVSHLLSEGKVKYLSDDMGLGKTLQAIVAADNIVGNDMCEILVICPASVKLNWQKEIKENSISPIKYSVTTYNKIDVDCKPADVLILDEAHFIKNINAQRTQKVIKLWAKTRQKVILLSGTPMTRSAEDLFVPCMLAGLLPEDRLHWFKWRFCYAEKEKFGWKFYGAKNEEGLQKNFLSKFMFGRKKGEVLNLPEKIRSNIPIKIPAKLADDSQKSFLAFDSKNLQMTVYDAHGNEAVAKEHFAKLRKEVGVAKVKSAIEFIRDKFDDTDEQAVIFAYHTDVIEKLKEGLDSFVVITGATSQVDRQKAVDAFQNKEVKYLIGNVLAAGTGITLTSASNVVFVEVDITPTNNWQAEDRIHRIGQKSTCNYYYLNAVNSMDDDLFRIINAKEKAITKVMGR
jgi:SWI/SNF-related matrix-associated actin-dependent regulator 1 of chromatin subfamily A